MPVPTLLRRAAPWALALLLALSAAAYQRLTGPTRPRRVEYSVGGRDHSTRLPRSGWTGEDARVALPDPARAAGGRVVYKRYRTDDEPTSVPLARERDELAARLPTQPPAGKLEYHVLLDGPRGAVRLPADGEVVIRYKGRVPAWFLAPHVVLMFLSLLLGIRTGLAALLSPGRLQALAWTTLACLTVGGMVLGPVVQKYAFGAFWTGWPRGGDLTDNKVLVTWLVWIAACAVLRSRPGRRKGVARAAAVAATVVMLAAYLIPHSLLGSELDYDKLDQGVPASEAIETG